MSPKKKWKLSNQLMSPDKTYTWETKFLSLGLGCVLPIFTKILWSVFFRWGSLLFCFISVNPTKYDLLDYLLFYLFGFCNVTDNFFRFLRLYYELDEPYRIEFTDLFKSYVPKTEFVFEVFFLTKLLWSFYYCNWL